MGGYMLSLQGLSYPSIPALMGANRVHSLWLSMFMSALDGTIISTALLEISSDFGALDRASWLVTSYLLTYNGKTHFRFSNAGKLNVV
jgi:MFS family permease